MSSMFAVLSVMCAAVSAEFTGEIVWGNETWQRVTVNHTLCYKVRCSTATVPAHSTWRTAIRHLCRLDPASRCLRSSSGISKRPSQSSTLSGRSSRCQSPTQRLTIATARVVTSWNRARPSQRRRHHSSTKRRSAVPQWAPTSSTGTTAHTGIRRTQATMRRRA